MKTLKTPVWAWLILLPSAVVLSTFVDPGSKLLVGIGKCALAEASGSPKESTKTEQKQVGQLAAGAIAVIPQDRWDRFRGVPTSTGLTSARLGGRLQLLWKKKFDEAGFEGSAAIVDGVIYVGSLLTDGHFYALDLKSGEVKWKFPTEGGFRASPLVHNGVVYIGDADGVFYALEAGTGKVKWKVQTDGEIVSSANVYKQNVLFGSYDQHLYCLKAATGKLVWKYGIDGPVHASPTVIENRAFVAGCDEQLHVVDLDKGDQVATLGVGSQAAATPAAVGSRLYLGNLADTFYCIDWTAPKILWSYQHATRRFPFYSSAALSPKAVIVGGRNRLLHALDPQTGQELWTFATRARVESSPVIEGNRVWVGSDDGRFYGVDLNSGKKVFEYEAGGKFAAGPTIAQGRLVIGNDDGTLYCFGSK